MGRAEKLLNRYYWAIKHLFSPLVEQGYTTVHLTEGGGNKPSLPLHGFNLRSPG